MEPLNHKSFPLTPNARRVMYWLSAFILVVSTYLGAREVLDSIDMAFVTGFAGLIAGMAGVNTPKVDGK